MAKQTSLDFEGQDQKVEKKAKDRPARPAKVPKPRPKRISRAAWILLSLIFLAAIILDAFFSDSGILQMWQLERDYNTLQQEIRQLETQNQRLQDRIDFFKTDPRAVEKMAREELNLVKPGEDVYIFPEEPGDTVTSTGETTNSKK